MDLALPWLRNISPEGFSPEEYIIGLLALAVIGLGLLAFKWWRK